MSRIKLTLPTRQSELRKGLLRKLAREAQALEPSDPFVYGRTLCELEYQCHLSGFTTDLQADLEKRRIQRDADRKQRLAEVSEIS